MKDFNTFGIKPVELAFVGEKIKLDRVLNKKIIVHHFKIEKSNYEEKGNGKRLDVQIEVDGAKRKLMTGSVTLMEMIQRVPEFPFATVIIKDNDRPEFT